MMNTLVTRTIGAMAFAFAATGVVAQETENRVAANTDWSVFVESNPTQCFAVSSPKETENKRNGRLASVNRSQIAMFVSYTPSIGEKGVVSFMGGYPFATDSFVNVTIGSDSFDFVPQGERAWSSSAADDAKIVAAMKRGSRAVVKARSTRGTDTTDTFSLLGFTASLAEAEKRCAQ